MKVVYASYPNGNAMSEEDVLASAENALGLRPLLGQRGHVLVATSETGDSLDRELADADVAASPSRR